MTEAEEEKLAAFLLRMAEKGNGNGQHPDDDCDYGRKKLTEMLPHHPSVVQKLVELEVKFRLEGFVGKVEKKWWQFF